MSKELGKKEYFEIGAEFIGVMDKYDLDTIDCIKILISHIGFIINHITFDQKEYDRCINEIIRTLEGLRRVN